MRSTPTVYGIMPEDAYRKTTVKCDNGTVQYQQKYIVEKRFCTVNNKQMYNCTISKLHCNSDSSYFK